MSKSIKFGSGRTSTAFSREVNADAAPSPENVSQSEIERLEGVISLLVGALRESSDLIVAYRKEFAEYDLFFGTDNRAIDARIRAALNAVAKRNQEP